MSHSRRLGIKVDCDTYMGTKDGIPNLLRLFDKCGIRASFFFTLGPDNSGRAITRIFRHKGFLKKMLRSNAVSLYGPRTMLYGTLLPAPVIGKKLAPLIRSVGEAGHEVGVHGWDHVRWHDRLGSMNKGEIEDQYSKAHAAFEEIFRFKAHSSAAPGWHVTPSYLLIQDSYQLLYTSNTRLGSPYFPMSENYKYKTLEIPTTLPTWDEMLGSPEFKDKGALIDFYGKSVVGTEVHTIHTEVEGTAHLPLFEQQLERWVSEGVQFLTLETLAKEILANPSQVPFRHLVRINILNRAGLISSGSEMADNQVFI
jgi:peptidoglycan/xylan/chitin deacetylase (PgdA/CDA1 family)